MTFKPFIVIKAKSPADIAYTTITLPSDSILFVGITGESFRGCMGRESSSVAISTSFGGSFDFGGSMAMVVAGEGVWSTVGWLS